MKTCRISLLLYALGLVLLLPLQATAQKGWFVTLYGGQFVDNELLKVLFQGDIFHLNPEDSHLATVSLSKELARWKRYIAFELEGQIGRHFGLQDNWEFNALVVFRWLLFPWDRYLDTSFAFGEGFSYATEEPFIESEFQDADSVQFMNYILLEFEFALPTVPHWSLLTRLHHRSGIFGVFGTGEGSNFVGLGVRYRF